MDKLEKDEESKENRREMAERLAAEALAAIRKRKAELPETGPVPNPDAASTAAMSQTRQQEDESVSATPAAQPAFAEDIPSSQEDLQDLEELRLLQQEEATLRQKIEEEEKRQQAAAEEAKRAEKRRQQEAAEAERVRQEEKRQRREATQKQLHEARSRTHALKRKLEAAEAGTSVPGKVEVEADSSQPVTPTAAKSAPQPRPPAPKLQRLPILEIPDSPTKASAPASAPSSPSTKLYQPPAAETRSNPIFLARLQRARRRHQRAPHQPKTAPATLTNQVSRAWRQRSNRKPQLNQTMLLRPPPERKSWLLVYVFSFSGLRGHVTASPHLHVAKKLAAGDASLRRCVNNFNRASYEMVLAWEQKGQAKTNLLKRWMTNPDVASITAEIIMEESFEEHLCLIHGPFCENELMHHLSLA